MTSSRLWQSARLTLLWGLPAGIALCAWMRYAWPGHPAPQWAYHICLAGFVGIATNSLAIRMLFRPQQRTFLGRQGLIPANRSRIATTIAAETERRLLNVDSIMGHIERGRIIEDSITALTGALEAALAAPANRRKLAALAISIYNRYADRLFDTAAAAADVWLADLLRTRLSAERLWRELKPRLHDFFNSPQLKQQTARLLTRLLTEHAPRIAAETTRLLEQYIDAQAPLRRLLVRGLQAATRIDRRQVERIIYDIINDRATQLRLEQLIEDNLERVDAFIDRDDVQQTLQHVHTRLADQLHAQIRRHAIPALRRFIDDWLARDSSWQVIDTHLTALLAAVPAQLHSILQQPANIQTIRQLVPALLARIDVRSIVAENIAAQDVDEFERMIMKVSGDNFAAIEVLGGVLGMLAGTAITQPLLLLGIPALLAAVVGADQLLGHLRRCIRPCPDPDDPQRQQESPP